VADTDPENFPRGTVTTCSDRKLHHQCKDLETPVFSFAWRSEAPFELCWRGFYWIGNGGVNSGWSRMYPAVRLRT
jgi:hypothetical protein